MYINNNNIKRVLKISFYKLSKLLYSFRTNLINLNSKAIKALSKSEIKAIINRNFPINTLILKKDRY